MSGRGRRTGLTLAPALALVLALAWACLLAGCGPAVERPGSVKAEAGVAQASQAAPAPQAAPAASAAPANHRPSAWWRAQHSAQLGGAGSLWPWARPAHHLGECLVCHRPAVSCDPCHAYVGVPAVGGAR